MANDMLNWTSPASWMALAAALACFWLGALALLKPGVGSLRFGVPLWEGKGLAYVQSSGARNMGFAVAAFAFLALGQKVPLSVMAYVAAFTFILDAVILIPVANPHLAIRRGTYAAVLVILGTWLLI